MEAAAFFNSYPHDPKVWDEMHDAERIREQYRNVFEFLLDIPSDELNKK